MLINPTPSGTSQRLDMEGNSYYQAWFLGETDSLSVRTSLKVEIEEINPLGFLIEEQSKSPFTNVKQSFSTPVFDLPHDMRSWAKNLIQRSDGNQLQFLSALCTEIAKDWDHQVRYQFDLMDPEICFREKAGSCRDLSWMMIQVLRNEGFASRFVSGYSFNPELGEGHELHAWVEVWLEGGGWVALDPSAGIFCNQNYLPVSASYHPFNTLPVLGSYHGSAISSLETKVEIGMS